MPLSPRRLPRQFNRSVTSHTRKLVHARHERRRKYARERWKRAYQRFIRHAKTWRKLLWRFLAILAIGIVCLAVWLAFFSPAFSLTEIRVRRTDRRLDEELMHAALRPLIGNHLFYLSGGEVQPLLTSPLPRAGRPAVPDLASVSVSKDYPSTMIVSVELSPVIARLAIEEPGGGEKKEGTGAILADYLTEDGMYVTYVPSQVASGAALPLIRIVDWSARPQPWHVVLEPSFLEGMRKAEQSLTEQFGQPVTERIAYLRAKEFHLKLPAYMLWFDFKSTLEEQVQRYRLFLRTAGASAATRYVDLRLRDRIVYR